MGKRRVARNDQAVASRLPEPFEAAEDVCRASFWRAVPEAVADALWVSAHAPRVRPLLDEAARAGAARARLCELLEPPLKLTGHANAFECASELVLARQVLPLLAALRPFVSDDERLEDLVDRLTARLAVRAETLETMIVRPLGIGAGFGAARVDAPPPDHWTGDPTRAGLVPTTPGLMRLPVLTHQAETVYRYLRERMPAARRRGRTLRSSRGVLYHRRAGDLTVRLLNAVYQPVLDEPLTVERLFARVQRRAAGKVTTLPSP